MAKTSTATTILISLWMCFPCFGEARIRKEQSNVEGALPNASDLVEAAYDRFWDTGTAIGNGTVITNPAFVFNYIDLSGVGKESTGHYHIVTMFTPTHFATVDHVLFPGNATVRFYKNHNINQFDDHTVGNVKRTGKEKVGKEKVFDTW